MNIELLQEALQNDNNLNIINTNIQEIKAQKNDILQQLGLKKTDLKEFHSKLKDYRYIDDIKDLNYGNNIRWISLKNIDNVKITNGAVLCDIKILDKGLSLCLKTFNNKYFTIYLNENLIFQKISDQERILLKAIDYLNK
jgi:TPP-dependent trihydroxycyclohexane-1,2-dione (THcHDO) dehydratase|tara:strand:- start:396 stop:815 length:420 start_codon:yes stop_codon:yes gene_type:complete